MNIRKGDTVLVIGGKEKGRRGKVEKVLPRREQGDHRGIQPGC